MKTYTFNVVYLTGVEETVVIEALNVLYAHAMVKANHPLASKIEIMGVKSNV